MFGKLNNVLSTKKIVNTPLVEDSDNYNKLSDDIIFDGDIYKYMNSIPDSLNVDNGYLLHEKVISEMGDYNELKKMLDNISDIKLD